MESKNKEAIKKIISEEIERLEKIKSLQVQKKQLSEAIKLIEEGGEIDEISWQGIKNAVGFGAKTASNVGSSINKGIDKKIHSAGKAIGNQVAKVADKISTGYHTIDDGLTQFGNDLGKAMTAGDVQALEAKMTKMFIKLDKLVSKLNEKQVKLGVKPTTMKSLLFKAANKAKASAPVKSATPPANAAASTPALAEGDRPALDNGGKKR